MNERSYHPMLLPLSIEEYVSKTNRVIDAYAESLNLANMYFNNTDEGSGLGDGPYSKMMQTLWLHEPSLLQPPFGAAGKFG